MRQAAVDNNHSPRSAEPGFTASLGKDHRDRYRKSLEALPALRLLRQWGDHSHDISVSGFHWGGGRTAFDRTGRGQVRHRDRPIGISPFRHAQRDEKSDRGRKVVDDDADVVQSLDRHGPRYRAPDRTVLRVYKSRSPTVAHGCLIVFAAAGKLPFRKVSMAGKKISGASTWPM